MGDLFADAAMRALLLDQLASHGTVLASVAEKDLWVCWTLARLHEIPGMPRLTFKGGTSLSKVHRLIDRFSEDIDLTFSREGWGFDGDRDPLREGMSGKQRQRLVDEISQRAREVVRDIVAPGLRAICAAQIGGTGWSVEVDSSVADQQTIVFTYPTQHVYDSYMKPVVVMELGARGDPWPTAARRVCSLIEDAFPGEAPESVVTVDTLDPERTFWEKATLLHALHHHTLSQPDRSAARQSRHLYDLHRMWAQLSERVMANPRLLDSVVKNKMVFFKSPPSNFDLVLDRVLNAAPHPALEEKLRADFRAMSGMFFPGTPVPTFDAMLGTLREIDEAVAQWRR